MIVQKYDDFDEFILWLKEDGLRPHKSERLWRKTIFTKLINGDKLTMGNYNDFLESKKLKNLVGKVLIYQQFKSQITTITKDVYFYRLKTNEIELSVKFDDLDTIIDKYIQGD